MVGNTNVVYKDTKYIKGSELNFGKIYREQPISSEFAKEYDSEFHRMSELFGITPKITSIDVMAYQNDGIFGSFSPNGKVMTLYGVGGKDGKSKMIKIAKEHYKNGDWSTSSYLHTFRHEMAHAIQEEMKRNDPHYSDKISKITDIRKNFFESLTGMEKNDIINKKVKTLSLYGLDDDGDIDEFISECMAEYANQKPRQMAKNVVSVLIGVDDNGHVP